MSHAFARVVRVVAVSIAGLTSPLFALAAQTIPFSVTGVSAHWIREDDDGTLNGALTFTVKNVSASSQTFYVSGDCGPFHFPDYWENGVWIAAGECEQPNAGPVTLGSGQTFGVNFPIYLMGDGQPHSGLVSIRVASSTYPVSATAQVWWNYSAITATLIESTFTPAGSDNGTVQRSPGPGSADIYIYNSGNAAGVFTVGPPTCTGAITACALAASAVPMSGGSNALVHLTFTGGSPGQTGTASIPIVAPPRASGLVETATAHIAVSIVDLLAPTIVITPRGDYDELNDTRLPLQVSTRQPIVVDVCDADGTVGTPTISLAGGQVAPASVVATSVAGCATAKRAVFNVPFQSGTNTVSASISDGFHTATDTEFYQYDDARDHKAMVAPAHVAPTVQANRTAVDTFFVTNPGWRSAQYTLAATCSYEWNPPPTCALTLAPLPSVSVAAGATVAVPISYVAPSIAGRTTSVALTASLAGSQSGVETQAWFRSTAAALSAPQITITPANGAVITGPTTNVSVTWCDADDSLTSLHITSQGQPLSLVTAPTSTASCAYLVKYTWTKVRLDPWQHTFVATAVDQAGHSTTVSSTVAYSPAVTAFVPSVSPKALARQIPSAGSMVDTFVVTNAGVVAANYQITPLCGSHAGCTSNKSSVVLAPGATDTAVLTYDIAAGSAANDVVGLAARYTAPNGAVVADTGTRLLFPGSFTPIVSPKITVSVAQHLATGEQLSIKNAGSSGGVFTLSPPTCTGGLTTCSASPTSMFIAPGATGLSWLSFTTGAIGTGGSARVVVSAPARVTGAIERDSAIINVTVADLSAPTITLSPAGEFDPNIEDNAVLSVYARTPIVVDACDRDGTVGTPTLRLDGAIVAATAITLTSAPGCNTAIRATFAPAFLAGFNHVVVAVTDGVHTTSVAQTYQYFDAADHAALVTSPHSTETIPINRTIVDTFWVKNPGWHSADYAFVPTCRTGPLSLPCTLSAIPAKLELAAGATAAIPFSYSSPPTVNQSTTLMLAATYTGTVGSQPTYGTIVATTRPVTPPTIAVQPGDSAIVTTPTFKLAIDWCDEDDGIVQQTVVWEGRVYPQTASPDSMAIGSCGHGQRWVWSRMPIDIWQQSLVVTAVDQAGHSTTRSQTITYAPSLTEFRPHVVPVSVTERTPLHAAAADTFHITNLGSHPAGYKLSASCGRLARCVASESAIALNPGATTDIVVSFTSSGALDKADSIKLVATYFSPIGSTIADTGRAAVVVPSVEAPPSLSTGSQVTPIGPELISNATFMITNTSSVEVTYDLAAVEVGGWSFADFYVPPPPITLASGQSKEVQLDIKSPRSEGVSGSFTLTASYRTSTGLLLSASATSSWLTQTPRPGLVVTPKNTTRVFNANGAAQAVSFTLTATGNQFMQATATFECDGGAVCRWDALSPNGSVNLAVGESKSLQVAFDSVALPFHMKLRAVGKIGIDSVLDSATVLLVPFGPFLAATVAPKSASLMANTNQPIQQRFYITNTGNVNATVRYLVSCDGALIDLCQPPDHTSSVLIPKQRDSVTLMLTTPSQRQQSGSVTLIAQAVAGQLTAEDTGRVRVSTGAVVDIAVNARVRDPDGTIARDQCLTISAGDDAAFECGDLRLVHQLPATTTMARTRAPTLVYESRQHSGVALFAADVTLAPGLPVTSVTAHVTIDGRAPVDRTFPWNPSWSDGAPHRVVVPVDVSALPTNAYHFTFAVDADGFGTHLEQQDDGTQAIVNRAKSQFGPGWWLDGYEELKSYSPTQMLWIGGDGSTRLYTKTGTSGVWEVQPALDRPDYLLQHDGMWLRVLRNHATVQFDATLRHVATVNAQGHRTTFIYGDASHAHMLTSISMPVPSTSTASRTYVLEHDPTTQYLTHVTAPSVPGGFARRTTLSYIAVNGVSVVHAIIDPDGHTVTLAPDAFGRVSARVNRRGHATSFLFDEGLALKSATVDMAGTAASNITHSFCAAETAGLTACSPTPPVSDSLATWVDGPRNIGDTTWFALNEYGAPRLVVDAMHDSTSIERTDPHWPLLATKVTQPNGHAIRAEYDPENGLTRASVDVAPFGGADSRTTYEWDPTWEKPSMITSPTGNVVHMRYDAAGNRFLQWDGRGDSTTVVFTYNGSNQLESIRQPGAGGVTRLQYDSLALGNLRRSTTPLGAARQFMRDWLGRDSVITSPGASAGAVVTERFVYDSTDRVVIDSTHRAATPYVVRGIGGTASATTITLATRYDAEGNDTSVTRTGDPGSTLFTHYQYDAAHRKIAEFDARGLSQRWAYDPAGNDTAWTTRRGFTIRQQFDTLNRLTQRITPAASMPSEICSTACSIAGIINAPTIRFPYFEIHDDAGHLIDSVLIATDTAQFAYDRGGNMVAADNRDARVHRGYFPNGALAADTLLIGTYDHAGWSAANRFSQHRYVQSYAYDPSGRLLIHVSALPTGLSQTTYDYEPGAGLLDSIVDGSTHIGFAYDANARQSQRVVFGTGGASLSDTRSYDDDNQLRLRREVAGSNVIYEDELQYDQRGKVVDASIGSSLANITDHAQLAYSNAGALIAVTRSRGNGWTDEYQVDAFANVIRHDENRGQSDARWTDNLQGPEQLISNSVSFPRGSAGEEPSTKSYDHIDAQGMDASGNVTATRIIASSWRPGTVAGFGSGVIFDDVLAGSSFTRSYFGADEKLRIFQRTEYRATGGPRTTFSEYRYDALGRRVLARTQRDSSCTAYTTFDCLSTIDRFAWDGDQILAEFRASAPYTTQGSGLETEATVGSDLEGAVRYTHGGAIDQPLIVWKSGPSGLSAIVPHLSWRGGFEAGSYLDGSPTAFYWPARDRQPYLAPDSRATLPSVTTWMGSLMDGQVDASGLMYMRNRYYDPRVGKFTQEDPIGLAGGMNLYGFSEGDPVNYTDPFGLCGRKGEAPCPAQEAMVRQGDNIMTLGTIAGFVTGVGEAFATVRGLLSVAESGPALARTLGAAGEAASGLVKNTTRIPSLTGTAAYRIPDGLTATTLSEVKNVSSLSLTNQLRDFAGFAQQTGRTFDLYVRKTTELSGPLQQFIKDNNLALRFLK